MPVGGIAAPEPQRPVGLFERPATVFKGLPQLVPALQQPVAAGDRLREPPRRQPGFRLQFGDVALDACGQVALEAFGGRAFDLGAGGFGVVANALQHDPRRGDLFDQGPLDVIMGRLKLDPLLDHAPAPAFFRVGEPHVLGRQPVPPRVLAHARLAGRRSGSGGVLGVAAVGGDSWRHCWAWMDLSRDVRTAQRRQTGVSLSDIIVRWPRPIGKSGVV